MGQEKPPSLEPKRRIENLREVVLGFGKKQNIDESRRCPQCAEPTCLSGCPLGIDIPGFIRLLREDDASGALERIRQKNPFPAVCGRICPAPCEKACVFFQDGVPISIRALERYAADYGKPKKETMPLANGKKVAVIGAGPCGMSAAYVLARAGYGVTLFEAASEPGGLLRYGVPQFRLPQQVLNDQMADLEALGVGLVTDAVVGVNISLLDIFEQGNAAILLTTGAGVPSLKDMPGHDAGGVYYAEEFLTRAHITGKVKGQDQGHSMLYGERTAVVGRGMAALDAARLAVRLGQDVQLIIDGMEEQIGVSPDDLAAAVDEGVKVNAQVQPLKIDVNHHGQAAGVEVQDMDVGEGPDLLLTPSAQPPRLIAAETVVLAFGRSPNQMLKYYLPQLRWNADGSLWIDDAGLTSMEKIFAAGEVVTGAGSVVDAIARGKAAAQKIMDFLK